MDAADREVPVVVPNLPRENALGRVDAEEGVGPESVDVVAGPRFLFEYELRLERLFLSDRVVTLSTTVDALTGGGTRNDVYPEVRPRRLPREALLDAQVDRQGAVEESRSVVRHFLTRQFASYVLVGKTPDMEITREEFVYVLYWLVPTGWSRSATREVSVVDSITGLAVEREVERGAVDEDLFGW